MSGLLVLDSPKLPPSPIPDTHTPRYLPLPHPSQLYKGKKNFLPAVTKRALSPPALPEVEAWLPCCSIPLNRSVLASGEVQFGWVASSPLVNCFLKSETSMQGTGLSVSLRKCKNILWSLCQVPPSPLQQHLLAVAGLPTGVEWVEELCFSPSACTQLFLAWPQNSTTPEFMWLSRVGRISQNALRNLRH